MLTEDRPITVGDAPTDRNHEFLFIEGDRIVGRVYADCLVCGWKEKVEPPGFSSPRLLGLSRAAAHRPMVCGSRSSASAVPAAVQPCASSKMAYHRSRSLGVGARIIRRRKALASICHCSRNQSISLTPITNPSHLQRPANSVLTTNLPHPSAHFTLALV